MNLADIERLAAAGGSEQVEFKKSTGQLRRAGETLCGFLNAGGGRVLMGVGPDGRVVGQQVADSALRDVTEVLAGFEPAPRVEIERVGVDDNADVIVLVAELDEYQALLVKSAHARTRWENQVATSRLRDGIRIGRR